MMMIIIILSTHLREQCFVEWMVPKLYLLDLTDESVLITFQRPETRNKAS